MVQDGDRWSVHRSSRNTGLTGADGDGPRVRWSAG